jgi:hypothetical protein
MAASSPILPEAEIRKTTPKLPQGSRSKAHILPSEA